MATSKRPMVPSFIQKLDDKLLRNNPAIWQTRIHLVIYFFLLVSLLITFLCFVSFADARDYTQVGGWLTFSILVSLLGLVSWLIYLLRFNVFKRFGNWRSWDTIVNYIFSFISIGAIVSICFIPSAVQTFRANQQFGDEEVLNDINEINKTACFLEYDILPLTWRADTVRVGDGIIRPALPDTIAELPNAEDRFSVIDTTQFRYRKENSDSMISLGGSMYIFYESPDYKFVSNYNADEYTKTKVLSSGDIFRTYLKTKPVINRNELVARLHVLTDKWGVQDRYQKYDNYYINGQDNEYIQRIRAKYDLFRADDGISNVVRKKYNWTDDWDAYLRVFYYITLSLSLLLFMFRNSTARTFFLSLLATVVLSIFTGLLLAVSHDGSETGFYVFLLFYYVIFGGMSVALMAAGRRSLAQGIALNFFVFMTPFIPLIVAALYVQEKTKYIYDYPNPYPVQEINTTTIYQFAELAGPVLFLLLIQVLFRTLYRKWFAAPVD